MRRPWQTSTTLFATAADTSTDPLAITGLRGWRLREPASGRRYTVVRLETRGGLTGYGEGGPARAKIPVYQFLGGPTRYKARVLATLDGGDEAALGEPLQRAMRRGFKAFTLPIAARNPMTTLQAHVDNVRKRVERVRSMAGPNTDFVLDGAGSQRPGEAAAIARQSLQHYVLSADALEMFPSSRRRSQRTATSPIAGACWRPRHHVRSRVTSGLKRIIEMAFGISWGVRRRSRPTVAAGAIFRVAVIHSEWRIHGVFLTPSHSASSPCRTTTLSCCTNGGLGERATYSSGLPRRRRSRSPMEYVRDEGG